MGSFFYSGALAIWSNLILLYNAPKQEWLSIYACLMNSFCAAVIAVTVSVDDNLNYLVTNSYLSVLLCRQCIQLSPVSTGDGPPAPYQSSRMLSSFINMVEYFHTIYTYLPMSFLH